MNRETSHLKLKYSIIGAGSSGLFLTLELLKKGYSVDLYDHSGGVLKKFLVAGKGGLNLTHSEELTDFVKKYGINQSRFQAYLDHFSNNDLRKWFAELGIETYVGSSKRVFPTDKTAGEILKILLDKCRSFESFSFYPKYSFIDFNNGFILRKENDETINIGSEHIILSLGGGSYRQTGSDGVWTTIFNKMDIDLKPLAAINCGYEIDLPKKIIKNVAYKPLKNISLTIKTTQMRGEILFSDYGVEGSAIYALSRKINEEILSNKECQMTIDLKPDSSLDDLKRKMSVCKNKNSQTNFLRKTINLEGTALEVLKLCTTKEEFSDVTLLPFKIKNCSLTLLKARPLEEAISTAGGVSFSEVDDNLCLKKYPTVYVMGEMLDWDAPTGGYLLQGCFSMASWIASRINNI